MMNVGKNFGMNTVNAALSIDGRFTKKIDDFARKNCGVTLNLNGLREVARERIEAHSGKSRKCIIPQEKSRIYFGMSMNPTPLEQQLYRYAFNSGFVPRVNQLTSGGREKNLDSMLISDIILLSNMICGFALCSGDRDFVQIFDTLTANGIPCILFTAEFGNTHCSWELKARSTEVIDVLSLINDPRVFKPVSPTYSKPVSNSYQSNHNAYGNLTNTIERAIRTVMRRKSGLNKIAAFAFQDDVVHELKSMGVKLNIPLWQFLQSKSWKFCTGFYDQRATVSLR